MPERLLGAHMSTGGGFGKALHNGKAIGCTAVQVFTSSPRMWRSSPPKPEAIAELKSARDETGINSLVSHDSYLINMAAPDEEVLERSIKAFEDEMTRCHLLGIPYVVTHMGSHIGQGEDFGLQRLGESVKRIIGETPEDTYVTLETTAGQGTNLGYRFEHLAHVIEAANGSPRVVVCLDTCHVFVAGYDIRSRESYEATILEFDRIIGLDRLTVIHSNDALKELGSRVDRHAHIGEGYLGLEPFRFLINDPRVAHAPMIIETPKEERYEEDLIKLRELLA